MSSHLSNTNQAKLWGIWRGFYFHQIRSLSFDDVSLICLVVLWFAIVTLEYWLVVKYFQRWLWERAGVIGQLSGPTWVGFRQQDQSHNVVDEEQHLIDFSDKESWKNNFWCMKSYSRISLYTAHLSQFRSSQNIFYILLVLNVSLSWCLQRCLTKSIAKTGIKATWSHHPLDLQSTIYYTLTRPTYIPYIHPSIINRPDFSQKAKQITKWRRQTVD